MGDIYSKYPITDSGCQCAAQETLKSFSDNGILSLDNLGRVTASRQTTDGNNFDSSYVYNISGALVEETYPTGRKVKNTFEVDGDLAKIETQRPNLGWELRAQNFAYNSSGAISQIQIGNGLWETAQFNNRLQVTQLGLGNSPTDASVWKLNYEFGELDANGNVNQAKNNGNIAKQTVTSQAGIFTQTYRYDSLERLKEAKELNNGNQTWIQNFSYDRYGNRIGQNQTVNGITSSGTPTVDINTNRFTTGQGYTYDFAGNIVQDNQNRQFIFNGDNKQVEVKNAQNVTIGQYFYDADGKRIKKISNSETTVFVYSGGKLVAEFTATNATPVAPSTQYFGTDMLQSLRIITNQNAQIVSQRDFMPFGEDVPRANYGTDNNRFKFTTYQKDNETGLDFAEARYYNNANGRFTAVDPLLASGKSADPQTFNRYVYSLNSPLIMVDRDGRQAGFSSFFGRTREEVTKIKNVMLWGVDGDEQEVQRYEELRRQKLLEYADENGGLNIQNAYGDLVRVYPNTMNRINLWLWSNRVYEIEKNGGGRREMTPQEIASMVDTATTVYRVASPVLSKDPYHPDMVKERIAKANEFYGKQQMEGFRKTASAEGRKRVEELKRAAEGTTQKSGTSGDFYNKAANEMIQKANNMKDKTMAEAYKIEAQRLIQEGKGHSHK